MGRIKGSLNKKTIEENKPVEMTLDMEELKKEKSTEEKLPQDFNGDVSSKEDDVSQIIGIGPKIAEKLREKGYSSIVDIATTRADELSAVMNIGYAQAKMWIDDAMDKVAAKMKLKTAVEADKDKKAKQVFIKTGSSAFNNLLEGGVYTGSITGTVGRLSTGKSQIGFELIVDVLGRLKKKVVFIETEPDTFHLDRLKQIATKKEYNDINWNDLYICESDQIPTAKAQFLQYKAMQKALERGEQIMLVVIDSMNANFRPWSRSELLPIRNREYVEHFNLIKYLTSKYNLAWYLTFQIIKAPRPDQGLQARMKYGQEDYATIPDFVFHTVNNWISLEQIKTELWKATLFDSSHIDRTTCTFMLTVKGLQDEVK